MKKLIILMIAACFMIMSSGTALADKSGNWATEKHPVWSTWFDEDGDRISDRVGYSSPDLEQNASPASMDKVEMSGENKIFDFIQETKTYDYERDKGGSA